MEHLNFYRRLWLHFDHARQAINHVVRRTKTKYIYMYMLCSYSTVWTNVLCMDMFAHICMYICMYMVACACRFLRLFRPPLEILEAEKATTLSASFASRRDGFKQ